MVPPHTGANAMCEKCDEIDQRIAHYRELAKRVIDQQTLDGIARLIAGMTGEKASFHSDQGYQK